MIELEIDNLAFGGDGVGRHQGQAVFVPYTAPGDSVRCRVVEKKRSFLRAELVEVLSPAEGRCQPQCPVFGRCGGCQWQHLDYPTQLGVKEKLFTDILCRQLRLEEAPVAPIIGAASPWHYRSRVQFKCFQTQKGLAVGFFRRGSHHVEEIQSCPIAAKGVNQALTWIRRHLSSLPRPDRIPQVDVSVGDRGEPRLVVHDLATQREVSTCLQSAAEEEGLALFVQRGRRGTIEHLCGPVDVDLQVDDPPLWLGYGPGAFSQVNLEQNRLLVDQVVELACLQAHEKVLDLYCGMGNLTLPLARRCSAIVGVEDFVPAIEQARINARENEVDNVRFIAMDAVEYISKVDSRYDLVVLDPPRSGAFQVIGSLIKMMPERILYVSCDPMTLARDLKPLLELGYRLSESRAIDLFPQTYHLESISLLELA